MSALQWSFTLIIKLIFIFLSYSKSKHNLQMSFLYNVKAKWIITTIFILSLISVNPAFAQLEDYLVTAKRDTLYGKVYINFRKGKLQTATVKNDDGKKIYQVYQVLEIHKVDSTIYEAKKILDKYQFAKLVKPGYVGYYLYSQEEVTADKFNLQVLIRADGDYVTFSNMAFKKRVSEFLADCEAVKVNFEDGKYKIKDLDQILDDYNDCIDVRTKDRMILTQGNITTTEENTTKITEVDSLIASVKATEKLPNQSEVVDMLNDVRQKLSNNEALPGYLVGALKGALENNDDLLAQLMKIVE